MNVVIIEDEPLVAEGLKQEILRADHRIQVVKILHSLRESLEYVQTESLPDLFFSDIRLPDGLSFDVFRQFSHPVPVIFCTAYDQYALEAFRLNGIDYILKPFDEASIRKSIRKYYSLAHRPAYGAVDWDHVMRMMQGHFQNSEERSLLVYRGESIVPIRISQIHLIALEHKICMAYLSDGKKWILNDSLESLESRLGSAFFRANRQFLVRREAIRDVSQYFARKLRVNLHLNHSQKIIVSKSKAKNFLKWLANE